MCVWVDQITEIILTVIFSKLKQHVFINKLAHSVTPMVTIMSSNNRTEIDQQRDSRLAKRREAYRRWMESETGEQRQHRLQRRRQQRRANETPENRETRLSRMRASTQQQHANETPENRETRLSRKRASTQQQRANEIPENRETTGAYLEGAQGGLSTPLRSTIFINN